MRRDSWRSVPRMCRPPARSEEHTSELQSQSNLVCRLLLEKKKEQFVILTDKILGAHGEKLLVEGREFAAVDFGSDDAAQPVAGVHFPGFFFNDTATTEIYTLSLHDALPIYRDHGEDGRSVSRTAARHDPRRHHDRSEEHTSELQSQSNLVCRLLLEKKN